VRHRHVVAFFNGSHDGGGNASDFSQLIARDAALFASLVNPAGNTRRDRSFRRLFRREVLPGAFTNRGGLLPFLFGHGTLDVR
jgi:hypothetical protein